MSDNKGIVGPDGKIITVTTDGSKERLDVDAKISRYRPRVYQSITADAYDPNEEKTVFSFDGDGQLDFIAINTESLNMEIILEIDSVEVYRLNLDDLKNINQLIHDEFFVYVDVNPEFIDAYPSPVDFTSNIKIKVKNLDSGAKQVFGVFARYREKI